MDGGVSYRKAGKGLFIFLFSRLLFGVQALLDNIQVSFGFSVAVKGGPFKPDVGFDVVFFQKLARRVNEAELILGGRIALPGVLKVTSCPVFAVDLGDCAFS